jgi:hypothetical protein
VNWFVALWGRWIARKMPPSDDVDSDFLRTTGVQPSWDGIGPAGEATHADMLAKYPTQFKSPTYWDELAKSSDDTDKWLRKDTK